MRSIPISPNPSGVPLYPFFLEGVAADAKLNQADGMHPTAEGVDVIVKKMLPTVKAFLGAISRAAQLKNPAAITLTRWICGSFPMC